MNTPIIYYGYKTLKAYEQMCKPICQKIQMPQTAFDILMFFGNNPEYNTAADVVEIRGIKANLVSVNVDKLVQEGYLVRKAVKEDRRKYHLECSKKALPIIEEGRVIQKKFISKLFEGVDSKTQKILQNTIKTIKENIDTMNEK